MLETTSKSGPRILRTAQSIAIADAFLEPWPLEPQSIVSGNPEASGSVLSRSDGGRAIRGLWACTPGEFRWVWTYDETLVVSQGSATVVLEDGEIDLYPGVFAFFERGQSSVWRIKTPFRKAFHALSHEPLAF
jgi:uncharacterized cupin superfamily protein